jgi:anti-sigma regulatory factor (Ser/Thr protein kinase)
VTPGAGTAVPEEPSSVVAESWPRTPRSVGRARHLLVSSLGSWGMAHLADTAELILSELVTNSVRHAHQPHGHVIGTRFERLEGGVRIEVHDANTDKPDRREAPPDAQSGRGLALVNSLTGGQWGVSDRVGVGKLVWAVCAEDGAGAPR